MRDRRVSILAVFALAACGHRADAVATDAGDGGADGCNAGFDPVGDGCAPHLDACDDQSVPRAGGGCEPVGVPSCAAGFRADGTGGCDAILPADSCATGSFAVPGETTCHRLAPCGDSTWGSAPVDPTTLYVDASFSGTSSDGTAARPYRTIQGAIDASAAGAKTLVAIAAGTYAENVRVDKPVRLWGRCPEKVVVTGDPSSPTASTMFVVAPAEVRSIAITSAATGIETADAGAVLLDSVWVHDTAIGIRIAGSGEARLHGALIEHSTGPGVYILGARVTLDSVAVRDAVPASVLPGFPLFVSFDAASGKSADVHVTGSLFERGVNANVLSTCSALSIERSLVRDARLFGALPPAGLSVASCTLAGSTKPPIRGSLTARDLVITDNPGYGLELLESDGTIERVTVRRTLTGIGTSLGIGIGLLAGSNAKLSASLVEKSLRAGLAVVGTVAIVDHLLVRDTEGQSTDGKLGFGLIATPDPTSFQRSDLTMAQSLILRSRTSGIVMMGSTAKIDGCAVRDTRAQRSDGLFGDGIAVASVGASGSMLSSDAVVSGTRVEASARAGISLFGAKLAVRDSVFSCSGFDIDIESSYLDADGGKGGVSDPSLSDGGGTICGCDLRVRCAAQSNGLEPIAVPTH